MRLLLVEDNSELAKLTAAQFVTASFDVDIANTAGDANAVLEIRDYAAVILDLGLPDGCGLDVLRKLRAARQAVPVLLLTARGEVLDRVTGLELGADDYLVKPFAFEELKARVNALLRRPSSLLNPVLECENVRLDPATREAVIADLAMILPQRESQLLELLLRRAGRVVQKSTVEDQLFGMDDDLGSNAVEVYVHRLRKRLEQSGARVSIHTVRGVGYLLSGPREGDPA
ncbi:MAG: response regulator transcription factor [Rhodospirillales bacterium]|nr:response regulator transcription factor [Acetobacter sp.]